MLLQKAPRPGGALAFTDTAGHWAAREGYIQAMVAEGAIAGFPDGTFRPDAPVTRGQLIKLAAALSGLKPEGTPSYTDIAPADWHYGWAPSAAAGRLIGWNAAYPIWTGDILAAETPVTRAEAATVLANMLEH